MRSVFTSPRSPGKVVAADSSGLTAAPVSTSPGVAIVNGRPFVWDALDKRSHNGGTIFRPANVDPSAGGRWLLVYDGPVYVDWFGAYGDTTDGTDGHDDTTPIQAAIDYAKAVQGLMVAFTAGKKYRIDGILDVNDCTGVVLGTVQTTAGYRGGAALYFTGNPASSSYIAFGNTLNAGLEGLTCVFANKAFSYTRGAIAASRASDINDTGYLRLRNCLLSGPVDFFPIAGATNTNPVEITTTINHGLQTGTCVYIAGMLGNTSPNGMALPVTVTAANKFTFPVAGNGIWTSGGLVEHATIPRMVHLGQTNNAHIHHCNFQYAQIHIWGQGEGIANTATIDGICAFSQHSNCAIANPGQAWTIAGNTFELTTAINCFGPVFPIIGLDIFGNWFGDGQPGNRWIYLVSPQGLNIHGNVIANSQNAAPIVIRAGAGIGIHGNFIDSTQGVVEFTGPEFTQFVHVGPNSYFGTDANMVRGRQFVTKLVTEGQGLVTDGQMTAPSGFIGGAFLTGNNAPVPATANLCLSGPLGVKPTFGSGAAGAMFSWQNGFGDTPAAAICHWPPQNDQGSGHAFYVYDPAIAIFRQRVGHWLGPLDRRLYGSALFGKAGHLAREMPLANACPSGLTPTPMLDAGGAATFAMTSGFMYRVRAEFLVCEVGANPTHVYGATIYAVVGCAGGVASLEQPPVTSNIEDLASGGISVSLTTAGAILSFNVTNNTGVTCRGSCVVTTQELVTT